MLSDEEKEFWNEKVVRKDRYIFVEGFCYFIGVNKLPNRKVYKIVNNVGDIITTTDLLCKGKVPDELASLLPDNATFIEY